LGAPIFQARVAAAMDYEVEVICAAICPAAHYYPLLHCGTSFGNYKEVREYLLLSAELREKVRKILGKIDRLIDGK